MLRAVVLVVLLLPLAACAEGPQAFGITGPQGSTLGTTPPPNGDPLDNPDALLSGARYGPGSAPSTGGGRYWGAD